MTRKEIFEKLKAGAESVYDEREALSVSYLLCEAVFGFSRLELALDPAENVTDTERLETVLSELASGRPVQYIIGHAIFCGLELEVSEGVLIPRPETEELVDWIIQESSESGEILDLGTGSGAIAVALARALPSSRVSAVDISAEALRIARRNAARSGVQVEFYHSDLFDPSSGEKGWVDGPYEVIVSNPPYIPEGDKPGMHRNVTAYEPHEALFVEDGDQLRFYRRIALLGQELMRPGGRLYFEIYERNAEELLFILRRLGYHDCEVRKDINGKPRMVKCRKN